MDTIRICNQCRKTLPENAPQGLCPECLARVALGSEPANPARRVPPEPEELAAQFPQLEIIELLGMGGMGMVYKARQPRLDRMVALKVLPVDATTGSFFAERFEREARALAKLNHPGIVTLYDFGQTSGYFYFVMEYVDGMNLRQLLKTKTVAPRQALELVTQICTALQFAHDEKIVHRDIKPENILITRKGQVKIADFGLAKLLGGAPDTTLTASQMVMGTIDYMAPEQREKPLEVDHRADIYSLGVVFYEMLTGELPMGRFEAPSKRVQVDVRLDEVVLRALEREPARRYQQASEVKSGVETVTASGLQTPPAPAGATTPVPWRNTARFHLLRAFGLFLAGWLVTKLLWNFRSPGCWVGSFGMATLTLWVAQARMRLFPEQAAVFAKIARSHRISPLVISLLCLAIGYAFLIGGLFNFWDHDLLHGNYAASSAEQYEAQYKGKEYHLIQNLPAFKYEVPQVEMAGFQSWTGGWGFGWSAQGPGHHYNNSICNLLIGGFILWGFTFVAIGAWRAPGGKAFPLSVPHIRASLAICAVAFASIVPIFFFNEFAFIAAGTAGTESRGFDCSTNIDAVTGAIENWATNNGYAMGDREDWYINTVPKGELVAQARLREAWKPSPFDRWHATVATFKRVSPFLAFELIGSKTPGETRVTITSAMDCTLEHVKNGTCHRIPEELIAVMEHLKAGRGDSH